MHTFYALYFSDIKHQWNALFLFSSNKKNKKNSMLQTSFHQCRVKQTIVLIKN